MPKNKNIEYWLKRAKQKDKTYIKDVKAIEKKLKQEYVKAKKEIQKESARLANPRRRPKIAGQIKFSHRRILHEETEGKKVYAAFR